MMRTKLVHAVLALLLVALLPLEQARCACPPTGGTAVAARADAPACARACCASHMAGPGSHRAAPARPSSSGGACPCMHPSAPEVPVAVGVSAPGPEIPLGAAIPAPRFVAPVTVAPPTVPALDVGRPPSPVDPGAHGLRAPPLSA